MTASDQTAVSYLIPAGSSVPCGMGPRKVKLDTHRKRSVVWSFFRDIDEASVQCVLCNRYLHKKEHGSTTPMLRHLRLKHPSQVYKVTEGGTGAAASPDRSCEGSLALRDTDFVVEMDNDESNTGTTEKDSDPSPAVGELFEGSQRGSLAHLIHEDDLSHIPNKQTRRRSLIWRLFEHLDSLNAARCRICMKKLHKSGGISNLRRHLVKRHPKEPDTKRGINDDPDHLHEGSTQEATHSEAGDSSPSLPKNRQNVLRQSEVEIRVFERELELIEALRRAQREEGQALQQRRELLEKLQTLSTIEAAAEREKIKALRKAQQEEAEELSRQREELEKEKTELQKKWEELRQEREEFLLLSKGKDSCPEENE
uniref:Uncharacterized LOC105939001 n=1 Tax=Fundulus heteroclitus TaxID=8078 RepID=A0A3Q2PE37_FUNHE